MRIFTGAAVPDGADRVIIQEIVRREGELAHVQGATRAGDYVRALGSDFLHDETLVEAGARLTPQRLVAAGAGDVARVEVWRRPRLAVLTTGDELAAPGQARHRPDAIPESVSLGVAALARAYGAEVVSVERLRDDLQTLRRAAAAAVGAADLVVVTGGASVGEKDFARAMFEELDLRLVFSKVAIKPGKPVWLGRAQETHILGLPGNPTSAMVTARLFLAPLVSGLCGAPAASALEWQDQALAADLPATDERETFYRATAAAEGLLPLTDQSSGAQKALAIADRLIRRRSGAPAARAGERVQAVVL